MTQRVQAGGRWGFRGALLFFSLYVRNVLVGKLPVMAGATTPFHTGDVPGDPQEAIEFAGDVTIQQNLAEVPAARPMPWRNSARPRCRSASQ